MDSGTPHEQAFEVLELLKLPLYVDVNMIVTEIFKARWQATTSKGGVQSFDYRKDFDLLYAMFKKYYQVDLIKDRVMWFEFCSMLEGLFLEDNALTTRMGYRSWVKHGKKHDHQKDQDKFHANKKLQYSISDNAEDGLKAMFKHAERLANG
jgi:hypothetical protein